MKTIRDSGQSDPSNGRGDRAHSALPEIPAEFLQEEFYRPASGPGGQHVNRTETGVRPLLREERPELPPAAPGSGAR